MVVWWPAALQRLIFALLVATVFGHIWFASTALPFGGPNVWLGFATAVAAAAWTIWWAMRGWPTGTAAGVRGLVGSFAPAVPVGVVALALWAWTGAVYLRTDTFDLQRFGQLTVGIGILWAIPLAVNSVRRAWWLLAAIAVATATSALFGLAILAFGDPFLSLWLQLAAVAETDLGTILTARRTAGVAVHTSTFSYQLAVALPLAFVTLLYRLSDLPETNATARTGVNIALFLVASILAVALLANASRSTMLTCGGVVIMSALLAAPRRGVPLRRFLVAVALLTALLLALFNPAYPSGDLFAKSPAGQLPEAARETHRPTAGGLRLARGAAPGEGHRIGHEFGRFRPHVQYHAQLRERLAPGVGRHARLGELPVVPDRRGNFTIAWPAPAAPAGVAGYQFRIRTAQRTGWMTAWRDFAPTLTSCAPQPAVLPAGWAVVAAAGWTRRTLDGLSPGWDYKAQVRAKTEFGSGAPSAIVTAVADDGGNMVLAWRDPLPVHVTGYQFRLWKAADDRWRPWVDFRPWPAHHTTSASLLAGSRVTAHTIAVARNAWADSATTSQPGAGAPKPRHPIRKRTVQVNTALRYAVANPAGAGRYRPGREHLAGGLSAAVGEDALRFPPHNQFLHVLVLFGLPGLALLIVFYALLVRSAVRAAKAAWRTDRADLRFLVVAVVAAWAAYTVNSLSLPNGPFVHDWGHFFIVGLLVALEPIVRRASGGTPAGGAT